MLPVIARGIGSSCDTEARASTALGAAPEICATLTLLPLQGVPGSGKSTVAKNGPTLHHAL
jgi:hypothetical protein